MALSGLHRALREPNNRERELLADDFSDPDVGDSPADDSSLALFNNDLQAKVVQVRTNTDQKMIVVTQDKTLLCLKRHLALIGKKEWIAPLSTVTTLLISLVTADFNVALGLGSAEWRAMFIVSALVATGWLAHALYKAVHAKTFHEVIRDIIQELGAHSRMA